MDINSKLEENAVAQKDHVRRMMEDLKDENTRKITEENMHRRYQVYLNDLFLPSSGKILDMGCGYANMWFGYLQERGFTYYGMDLNDDVITHMTNLLKVQGNDVYMRKGFIEKNPFPDSFFDVVYASHIFEHTSDFPKTLSEVKRILKPSGYLVFAVPCGYDDEPAHIYNRERYEWEQDFKDNNFVFEACGQFDFNLNEFHGRVRPKQSMIRKIFHSVIKSR